MGEPLVLIVPQWARTLSMIVSCRARHDTTTPLMQTTPGSVGSESMYGVVEIGWRLGSGKLARRGLLMHLTARRCKSLPGSNECESPRRRSIQGEREPSNQPPNNHGCPKRSSCAGRCPTHCLAQQLHRRAHDELPALLPRSPRRSSPPGGRVYGVQRTGGQSLRRRTLRQKKSARALPHCPRRVPHRGHPRASDPGRGPTRGRERGGPLSRKDLQGLP